MGKVREYAGKDITILYYVARCFHAEECIHGAPGVFQKDARPWVHADGEDATLTADKRASAGFGEFDAEEPGGRVGGAHREDGVLPLRGFGEQTLLRWESRTDWICWLNGYSVSGSYETRPGTRTSRRSSAETPTGFCESSFVGKFGS